MINKFKSLALCLIVAAISTTGCVKDKCTSIYTYKKYNPVFLSKKEIKSSIQWQAAKTLKNPGRVYVYNDFLLINEENAGLHFFNNSDPENPEPIGFLAIPGNSNMAIRNNLLYADHYNDLVTISLSDIHHPEVLHRTEGIFQNYQENPQKGILVTYESTEEEMTLSCEEAEQRYPYFYYRGCILVADQAGTTFEANGIQFNNGSPQVGTGGSMAQFTFQQDFLYVLKDAALEVFDLTDGSQTHQVNTVQTSRGMETIFSYKNHLFLGARNGMYIYKNSNPAQPVFLSKYAHINSCDPVYVSEDIAYVTLNGNGSCNSFSNQLDVIDVHKIAFPQLITSYSLVDPRGLAVRGKELYLCDGADGLKIYDVSDLERIDEHLLSHISGHDAWDVIALPASSNILVIGEAGLYQYDLADPAQPRLLSHLAAHRDN